VSSRAHPAARPRDACHVDGDVPAAAAEVQAAVPFGEPDPLQEGERRRAHGLGQQVEPPLAVQAAVDRVALADPSVAHALHPGVVPPRSSDGPLSPDNRR
jgi:hypothetical protein